MKMRILPPLVFTLGKEKTKDSHFPAELEVAPIFHERCFPNLIAPERSESPFLLKLPRKEVKKSKLRGTKVKGKD